MFKNLVLALALIFTAVPAYSAVTQDPQNPYVFVCSDGHKVRQTPFNQSQTPEQLCGEEAVVVEGPNVPLDFVLLFGERPTPENSVLRGTDLRAAQVVWEEQLANYGGLAQPNVDADVLAALADHGFNDPVFYTRLKGAVDWSTLTWKPAVWIAFPNSILGDVPHLSADSVSVNAGLALARAQVRAALNGVFIPVNLRHGFAVRALARIYGED